MRYIKLTKGRRAQVDNKYYDQLASMGKWSLSKRGEAVCHVRLGHRRYGHRKMHRAVLELAGVNVKDKQIDHRNRNKLHNNRRNLRIATKTQNGQNRGFNKNNSTGFKGVFHKRDRGNFRAEIQVNGCRKHLGTFSSARLAAAAYDKAAKKYFGRFAWLNLAC